MQLQQVRQACEESQQVQHVQQDLRAHQSQAVPQAAAEPQQGLFFLLMQAARFPAGTAAGLTPELAASFMMLMHRLPPGERAEKVRCLGLQDIDLWSHTRLTQTQRL